MAEEGFTELRKVESEWLNEIDVDADVDADDLSGFPNPGRDGARPGGRQPRPGASPRQRQPTPRHPRRQSRGAAP